MNRQWLCCLIVFILILLYVWPRPAEKIDHENPTCTRWTTLSSPFLEWLMFADVFTGLCRLSPCRKMSPGLRPWLNNTVMTHIGSGVLRKRLASALFWDVKGVRKIHTPKHSKRSQQRVPIIQWKSKWWLKTNLLLLFSVVWPWTLFTGMIVNRKRYCFEYSDFKKFLITSVSEVGR